MLLALITALACSSPEPAQPAADTACIDALWYVDSDGDGYGGEPFTADSCTQPSGAVSVGGDCDDADPEVHPGATEHCDAVDEDCDGLVDEEAVDMVQALADLDQDGWGDDAAPVEVCFTAGVASERGGDCDDTDAFVNPGAEEVWYDGVDQDCDGGNDFDADLDGYEALAGDCDDGDAEVHPGAEELCDSGVDEDCDGVDARCRLDGTYLANEAPGVILGSQFAGYAGMGLAQPADLDGDGEIDLAVGSPGDSEVAFNGGRWLCWPFLARRNRRSTTDFFDSRATARETASAIGSPRAATPRGTATRICWLGRCPTPTTSSRGAQRSSLRGR